MIDYKFLRQRMHFYNMTIYRTARAMGMSEEALRSRLTGRYDFRVSEAQRLVEILKLTRKEMLDAFFKVEDEQKE